MSYRRKLQSLMGLSVILIIPPLILVGMSYVASDPEFPQKITASIRRAEFLGQDGVVLQDKRSNCGPAALKMVFDYYQIPSTLREIERHVEMTKQGTSMLALKEMAELKGLHAEGWRYALEDFLKTPMPAIVFVYDDHFAVVDSIASDGAIIMRDPALGKLKIRKETFTRSWSGETLVFRSETLKGGV